MPRKTSVLAPSTSIFKKCAICLHNTKTQNHKILEMNKTIIIEAVTDHRSYSATPPPAGGSALNLAFSLSIITGPVRHGTYTVKQRTRNVTSNNKHKVSHI